MSFANARKQAKLSQAKVAEVLGVNQSCVSLWETGKTKPRARLLMRLADLYHCTVDDLLSENVKGV